jgi:hypothetical protein
MALQGSGPPCAAPPAASRVAQPAPRPISVSALTPRLRTLSHPIIGIPSAPGSRQLTTSPAARCPVIAPAENVQRCAAPKPQTWVRGCAGDASGPSATRNPPAARRACAAATSLVDPPPPQVGLHIGEPQLGQAGLPLGRQQARCCWIARWARYVRREAKPSSAALVVSCWSVLLRRVWEVVTWRGEG